jgi:cell division protease FtsH
MYARKYPYSRAYYENYLRRLNSGNVTLPDDDGVGFRIVIQQPLEKDDDDWRSRRPSRQKKSDHFEVVAKSPYTFADIGGYANIKAELDQCVDMLSNYTKYEGYNVRLPKGLIFEGPPGNGKTLFAKALAGEANIGFIAVSGAEFQDKYVGVGSSKVRELFDLAKANVPCIIFIDEIDAVGRRRSGDGETSSSERDSTLNELLVGLDGFKNSTGVFLIGATNRADLLDRALVRPGRIDKRVFIDNPDDKTREEILRIHRRGKPMDEDVGELVTQTAGFSAAQIENLLNEAMLLALRENRTRMTARDVDQVLTRMIVGWQPTEHEFTDDMLSQIAVHELGHAVVGMMVQHHAPVTKVVINLFAPTSPGYTLFAKDTSSLSSRETLFEHLMILLSGRIAEEVIFGKISVGAQNDFEQALELAQKMIVIYGMGKSASLFPSMSEVFKERIDAEVAGLIDEAYAAAAALVRTYKDLIVEGAEMLKRDRVLSAEAISRLKKSL